MSDIHIPQTSSWVTWPSSKRGTVHITAALPLQGPRASIAQCHSAPTTLRHLRRELKPGAAKSADDYVPIELKFSRSHFDRMVRTAALFQEVRRRTLYGTGSLSKPHHTIHEKVALAKASLPKRLREVADCSPQELLDNWALSISEPLHYFGSHSAGKQSRQAMTARWSLVPDPKNSQHRQDRQTLKSEFGGIPFRLVLRRAGLGALGTVASTSEGKRELAWAVRWHLLPYILTDWGLKGLPRGRHLIQAQFLQRTAAVAILMARTLIATVAEGDEALRKKLATILKPNVRSSSTQRQRLMALELAERTLRPAWTRHKISSPLDLDPNTAYKQLCPPHLRTELSGWLTQLSPHQRTMFTASWFRKLLGPAGQAARDFDLL